MQSYSTFRNDASAQSPKKTSAPEKLSPYTCELVGTFALVFVFVCCSNIGDKNWNPTVLALTLMAIIYSVAQVSGGHLNPCISVTMWLTRKISCFNMILYIVFQILGGVLAGLLGAVTFNTSETVAPLAPFGYIEALLVECFYTTVLCLVFVNVAGSTKKNPKNDSNQFFALAVGFVLISGGYAAGNISGAFFNPAVAIGLDLASFIDNLKLGSCLIYTLAEMAGSVGAAFLFFVLRHEEYTDRDQQELSVHLPSLWTRLAAEFVGTFAFVLTFVLNVMLGHAVGAASAAAAFICFTYAIGDISGGHFNPAISFAIALSGRGILPTVDAVLYMIVQTVAGFVCTLFIACFHFPSSKSHSSLGLQDSYTWEQAAVAEIAFTCLLSYTMLTVATARRPLSTSTSHNFYFGLAVGACISIGVFAIGPVSGGYLNPAVSLALAIEDVPSADLAIQNKTLNGTKDAWLGTSSDLTAPSAANNFLWYSVFELAGGAAAALLFHVTHPAEFIPPGARKMQHAQDV